jgi:hypothetical protein
MDHEPLPDDSPGTERVSTGVLPADTDVQALITAGYERYLDLNEGAVADYIPALASASPNAFGVCVAGFYGRLFSIGDADQEFAIDPRSTRRYDYAHDKLDRNAVGQPCLIDVRLSRWLSRL